MRKTWNATHWCKQLPPSDSSMKLSSPRRPHPAAFRNFSRVERSFKSHLLDSSIAASACAGHLHSKSAIPPTLPAAP
ncbi:hypothetical protein K470DRAFT_58071 [Piedraia hortae CBS 480.64]|uniref:Uncharacterized protein n=1 Tax=Piedraia hortae CBS 480.64 TaxID=1314780 RepID=A0A6A7C2C9_9PEZI|nr:hypothetical protein K470DRAFT_58071 [Piedraia hortae CBS 480.64]